jgi:hypothetical protein
MAPRARSAASGAPIRSCAGRERVADPRQAVPVGPRGVRSRLRGGIFGNQRSVHRNRALTPRSRSTQRRKRSASGARDWIPGQPGMTTFGDRLTTARRSLRSRTGSPLEPGMTLSARRARKENGLRLSTQPVARGVCRCPPGRQPEPRFRWARSAWRWVHLTRDDHAHQAMFPSPCSKSIGSRTYKARHAPQTSPLYERKRARGVSELPIPQLSAGTRLAP